jgi:hypothetical protein
MPGKPAMARSSATVCRSWIGRMLESQKDSNVRIVGLKAQACWCRCVVMKVAWFRFSEQAPAW